MCPVCLLTSQGWNVFAGVGDHRAMAAHAQPATGWGWPPSAHVDLIMSKTHCCVQEWAIVAAVQAVAEQRPDSTFWARLLPESAAAARARYLAHCCTPSSSPQSTQQLEPADSSRAIGTSVADGPATPAGAADSLEIGAGEALHVRNALPMAGGRVGSPDASVVLPMHMAGKPPHVCSAMPVAGEDGGSPDASVMLPMPTPLAATAAASGAC